MVGLLAFDSQPVWTIPIHPAADKLALARSLRDLQPGGGTNLYQALVEAHQELIRHRAVVKQLIVLSDGHSVEGEFEEIASRLEKDGVSITTVAVGKNSDLALMSDLARWGKGRAYYTEDMASVPRIFVTETLSISRPIEREKTFTPQVGSGRNTGTGTTLLQGLDLSGLPPLHGYVATTPKETASVHLIDPQSEDHAPILASWRYGLGRTIAYTSALAAPWGGQWLIWPGLAPLLREMIQWVMMPPDDPAFHAALTLRGSEARLTVDAVDRTGRFMNFLSLQARINGPEASVRAQGFYQQGSHRRDFYQGGSYQPGKLQEESEPAQLILLQQTAPGRYQTDFKASIPGLYTVIISSPENAPVSGRNEPNTATATGNERNIATTTSIVVPYSREFAQLGSDTPLLTRIAVSTSGEFLSLDADISALPLHERRVEFPLWPYLLLAALAGFLADASIRFLPPGWWHLRRDTTPTPPTRVRVQDIWERKYRREETPPPSMEPPGPQVEGTPQAEHAAARYLAQQKRAKSPNRQNPAES